MKKFFFYLFAALFIGSIMICCNRDDDETPGENPATGSAVLTAEHYGFDGAHSGKFSSATAGIVKTSAAGMTVITISGIRDGGRESINMVLYGDIEVNKIYALGSSSQNGIVIRKDYQNVTDQTLSYSTSNNGATMTGGGEVKITAVNGNKVEGTFYAVAYNTAGSEAYAEQGKFSGTVN